MGGSRRPLFIGAFVAAAAAVLAVLLGGPPSATPPAAPGSATDLPDPTGRFASLPPGEEETGEDDPGWPVVRGRVVEEGSGAPVPGAEVTATGRDADGKRRRRDAVTGADGRFAVAVPVTDGLVSRLEVGADGYRPWRQEDLPWPEGVLEVRLERSPRLVVRVVAAADGRPVPGVKVTAGYGPSGTERKTTDSAGLAVFTRIPGRVVTLDARGEGYRMDRRAVAEERRRLLLEPGREIGTELIVARTARLSGRVVGARGRPVPGASVHLHGAPGGAVEVAGEDGTFLLRDLLPGTYTLEAETGSLRIVREGVVLAPGGEREVEIAFPEAAGVEVTVRAGDTGSPVPGADVEIRSRNLRRRTGEDGRASLGPFEPGRLEVSVRRDGYLFASRMEDFRAGAPLRLDFTLQRGLSLSGQVRWGDGSPVEKAQVLWAGAGTWEARQYARTGPDGSFELRGLPPGELEIGVSRNDAEGREWVARETVPAGSTGVPFLLAPRHPEGKRAIEILVRGPVGRPVDRADVWVEGFDAEGRSVYDDFTDVHGGRAELRRRPGKEATIRVFVLGARTPSGTPLPLGAAAAGPFPADRERIEVVLPRERVVAGFARGPAGEGIARVEVEAHVTPWPGAEPQVCQAWGVLTGEDGAFRIGGLPEGNVELAAWPPGDLVQPAPVRVAAGARDVTLRLAEIIDVVVTVVDPAGDPVEDIYVEARQEAGMEDAPYDGWEPQNARERTGADGVARLADLVRGEPYRLMITRAHVKVRLAPRRIDGWRPEDAVIRLAPMMRIAGRAVWGDGTPLDGEEGQLWTWTRVGGWEPLHVDGEGRFRAEEFPSGPVALAFLPHGEDPRDEPVLEPGGLDRPVWWVKAGSLDILLNLSK